MNVNVDPHLLRPWVTVRELSRFYAWDCLCGSTNAYNTLKEAVKAGGEHARHCPKGSKRWRQNLPTVEAPLG